LASAECQGPSGNALAVCEQASGPDLPDVVLDEPRSAGSVVSEPDMTKAFAKGAFVSVILGLVGCSSHPKIAAPADAKACKFKAKRPSAGVRALNSIAVVDIAPGEAACLALEDRADPLRFQMSSDSSGVKLSTHNPYAEVLTFDALVYLEGESGGGYPSTTCPVKPGALGHELWEEPVKSVVLSRFELHHEDSAPTACD
jgi:uncharacterized protein YcfL